MSNLPVSDESHSQDSLPDRGAAARLDQTAIAIFDSLADGVAVFALDHALVYHSPKFAKQLPDLTASLAAGSVPSELATALKKVSAGASSASLLVEQAIAGMTPRSCELQVRMLRLSSLSLILTTARDVTERLIRERTQRENESLLGAILETCGVGLCLWDHRHRFVSCNRAFCELTGFRPEELVGRPLAKVLSTEEIERAQTLFSELLGGGKGHSSVASSIELRCRRKDGSLVDVSIAASVLLRDEGRRFVVGSVMDISERKEKQLELIERAIEAQREAESKNELNAALSEKLALIESQHQQILDLSAPILDVFDGVLLLPVIGSLDDARARTITERLLSALVSHRSRLVLIDLTAVETMDETSTTALKRMLTAIEMLGSRPIVTGISPQIAQLLTQLGDRGDILRKLETLPDLKAGVRYCLARR
ncbi:MAG: PAS domain S-box protein [Myxococcales bacterium]|nr:PAS domain S-box protein [Myxococcales bacterium]